MQDRFALIRRYSVALLIGAVGFLLMQGAVTFYRDWEFLHTARLVNEYQAAHPQAQTQAVSPGHVEGQKP